MERVGAGEWRRDASDELPYEEQVGRELPAFDQPAGVPATFAEHARLMFDLQLLAYQSDPQQISRKANSFLKKLFYEFGNPNPHQIP